MRFDNPPDNPIVDARITVDQNVAKADDAGQLRNAAGRRHIDATELVKGFTDDLELALDGGAEKVIGLVVGKGFSVSEPR